MAEAATTLVVNADDFGLSEGINRGIVSAFHQGIVRSASLMPNGRAFDDALEQASAAPGLDVGVHVSLVAEKSVSPARDLGPLVDPDGSLPESYAAFAKGYAFGRFGLREIRLEIEAQIRKVVDAGLRPTHVDSHQHLHVIPGVCDVLLAAAKAAGIRVVRVPLEFGAVQLGAGRGRRLQSTLLFHLSRHFTARARNAGFRFPDRFWGVGVSGRMDEAHLLETLRRLRSGVNEVMCHPGFSDPATEQRYRWHYHWDDEVAALCSGEVKRIVEEQDIGLASFADAWDPVSNLQE